ncbi:TetR/AcrR family transcriptional regulator [Salinarimonas sp.]|uniref:TetR/AcrR family transcriptional regulator n=1 Tax=Salinarimonas sp. TaxID=2766526 RepID=UPI003919D58B
MARTRANDYDDKRDAILRGSAAAFAERGVDRASMSQIAAECGVSKALLYHYYQNKEELVFDIIRGHLEVLDEALARVEEESAADGADADERLRRLVHCVLDHYRDSDDLHKVQLTGMATLPEDKAEVIRDVERAIVRRFAATLRAVNPALSGERPYLMPVTMSLFGMMNWVYMWFRPDGPISREEYADLATQLILTGAKSVR